MSATVTTIDAPAMATATVAAAGVRKAHLSVGKMVVLSVLAGVYIGVGAQLATLATSGDAKPGGPQLILGGAVFSVGLIMIVIAGAELFTGNCLLLIAVFDGSLKLADMLIDWAVVYSGNFVGAVLFAAMVYGMGLNGSTAPSTLSNNATAFFNADADLTASGTRLCAIAGAKAKDGSGAIFLRGVGANMLVCLAVIMAVASRTPSGKILSIVFPIGTFVALGMDHSIANMYFFSAATMLQCPVANHGHYWRNLVLATLGNILGAGLLALAYFFSFVFDQAPAAASPPPAAAPPAVKGSAPTEPAAETSSPDEA